MSESSPSPAKPLLSHRCKWGLILVICMVPIIFHRFVGQPWSYTSDLEVLGIPLVAIDIPTQAALRDDLHVGAVVGWIAVGKAACGILFGCGIVATGLVSFGVGSLGVMAFGVLAIGPLWSWGVVSIARYARGMWVPPWARRHS